MRLALLATLILCLATGSSSSSSSSNGNFSSQVVVSTGEEFVEATIKLAQEGGDVTLELSNAISLDNATWNVDKQASGRGFFMGSTLTVQGTSTDGPVVLDAAMKAGLAPTNARTAITWENIIFVNMCSKPIVLNPGIGLTGMYSNAMFFLPRSRTVQNTERKDCIVYIPRREFLGLLHWLAIDLIPFKAIQDGWAKVGLGSASASHAAVRSMDEHSISVEYMEMAGGVDVNVTYRSTSNPHDPFGIALPPHGSLMRHRLCSSDGNDTGTLLTERQVRDANFTTFPTWIATSSTDFLAELKAISEHAFADREGHSAVQDIHVEIMFILKDISLASEKLKLEHRPFLPSDTLLHGPLSSHRPNLDFAGNAGVLSLGAGIQFFIKNVALSGLKPVPAFNKDGTSEIKSCLQLVAIDRRERQIVQVADVTFQVPKDEFLVLLSAANRGAAWRDGAATTASLLHDISVFETKMYNRSHLLLAKYKGWDVEGEAVMFVPNHPLTEQEYQDLLDSDKGDVDKVALGVGIGVGVGLGVPIIIASVCLLAVVLRRKRRGLAHNEEGTGSRIGCHAEEGPTSIHIGSSAKRELSNAEGQATPKSKERIETQGVSCPQCTVSISSKTPRVSGEAATTKHNDFTKAIASLRGASEGSPPALSIDRIEIDESSMPIQKIAADQSASLPSCGFETNVRREVDRLLKGGAHDDSLRLEVLIGKGAVGAVYKGSWKGLTVAVKTVLFTARADELNRAIPNEARAVLEAAVCLSLSHPNIVSTYHYDIKKVSHHNESDEDRMGLHVEGSAGTLEDWKLFLVLEYCHGSLAMGIKNGLFGRDKLPNFKKMTHVLLDVAQGAEYLHKNHIIHGDVKPDNILLKADPSSPIGFRAKITDFGLSINLGPTATHVSNMRHGTPFYCSPEVSIDGRATKASDVFSFGIVLSELCSGTPPFQKVRGSDYEANPSFPYFPSYMPSSLKNLALRCMDTDTSARPTFKEIVSILQGITQNCERSTV